MLSVPGIGERTALALVLRMPELGSVSREQAAALAGLAPFVPQSGRWTGETHIAGGRLRRSLYAAALPAAFRKNAALKALYRRLVERGRPHAVTLVACARKLLVFANTVVARDTPWTNDQPRIRHTLLTDCIHLFAKRCRHSRPFLVNCRLRGFVNEPSVELSLKRLVGAQGLEPWTR